MRHVTGDTLDEHGKGEWPRDSYTFRLRDEGAIRLVEPTDEAAAAAKHPAKHGAKE